MRTWLWLLLLCAACGQHSPSSPSPVSSSQRKLTTRIVTTTRPDTLPPPTVDPRFEAWRVRYDSLVVLVDTIVVLSPDSIVLHVGQTYDEDSIRVESRRASGQSVPRVGHEYAIEDMSIAEPNEAGLTGLRVGRTRLRITVISSKAHAPPNYLPVIVLP